MKPIGCTSASVSGKGTAAKKMTLFGLERCDCQVDSEEYLFVSVSSWKMVFDRERMAESWGSGEVESKE